MNNGVTHNLIHKGIVRNLSKVEAWYNDVRSKVDIPIYSSFDIRDAGFKVTNVDGNIYPAGFNNICQVDREATGELAKKYLDEHYDGKIKKILILTEEHTQNLYYWDNVASLKDIFVRAGAEVQLAIPRVPEAIRITTASGRELQVCPAHLSKGEVSCRGFQPDLIISNNDFSNYYEEWGDIQIPLNPPRELGWYQRQKSRHFKHYNSLATQFAEVIQVDPWYLTVETELFSSFDMSNAESTDALVARVDAMFAKIRGEYARRNIPNEPTVFVKNNAGTYGLAVIRVASSQELKALNYKTRKKMKAAKGGREVHEVIIQEGVESVVTADGFSAEPAIYLLGCRLAGGFLRSHKEKGPTESLNSPGAVYKRLCVSDLNISVEGHPLENVYGWVAKLGLLAIGREAEEMAVKYQAYRRGPAVCER